MLANRAAIFELAAAKVSAVLQTLGSNLKYQSGEPGFGAPQQALNLVYWLDILKRRFLYFLGVFGVISILGLYATAIQKPIFLSEGKILLQSQEIAPDIITPVMTATASERAQLIQHRVMTRDNLLLIASKFSLFPNLSDASAVVDLMRKRTQIKPLPVEVDGQLRPNSRSVAFTVGFEHENPELAIRVANEFITMIVSGDENSRSSRTTEMIKLLSSQTKDIEDQLEANQAQLLEVARRPPDTVEIPEEQKSQLIALTALKAELTQKSAVYSDAHPVVIALRKRVAAMEKTLAQEARSLTHARSTPDDDIEALKRQRQALEKQLADANSKLSSARLREKLDLEQQERMQVIEAPSLPEQPIKSKKLLIVGIVLAAGAMLGVAAAIGPELLNGSIHSRDQLIGIVDSSLLVCVPYISTRADIVRSRLTILLKVIGTVIILATITSLMVAIALHWQPQLILR